MRIEEKIENYLLNEVKMYDFLEKIEKDLTKKSPLIWSQYRPNKKLPVWLVKSGPLTRWTTFSGMRYHEPKYKLALDIKTLRYRNTDNKIIKKLRKQVEEYLKNNNAKKIQLKGEIGSNVQDAYVYKDFIFLPAGPNEYWVYTKKKLKGLLRKV